MKRKYITPEIEVLNSDTHSLMTISGTEIDNPDNTSQGGGPEMGNTGSGSETTPTPPPGAKGYNSFNAWETWE